MALEALKAEIALLLEMTGNAPHDRYEFYIQLKEKLNEFRVFGNTPPNDFLELLMISWSLRPNSIGSFQELIGRTVLRILDSWKGFNSPQPQAPPVCVRPHLPNLR